MNLNKEEGGNKDKILLVFCGSLEIFEVHFVLKTIMYEYSYVNYIAFQLDRKEKKSNKNK